MLGGFVGFLQIVMGVMIGVGLMPIPSNSYIALNYILVGFIIIMNRMEIDNLK